MMRILSVKIEPVARVMAILYAVLGFVIFIVWALGDAPWINLPIGFVAPMLNLSLSIHLTRSSDLLATALECLGAILSYGVSGWLSGMAFVLCFNAVTQKLGGIDVKYVTYRMAESPVKTEATRRVFA